MISSSTQISINKVVFRGVIVGVYKNVEQNYSMFTDFFDVNSRIGVVGTR